MVNLDLIEYRGQDRIGHDRWMVRAFERIPRLSEEEAESAFHNLVAGEKARWWTEAKNDLRSKAQVWNAAEDVQYLGKTTLGNFQKMWNTMRTTQGNVSEMLDAKFGTLLGDPGIICGDPDSQTICAIGLTNGPKGQNLVFFGNLTYDLLHHAE
jgi:hypothetical protein